MYSYLVLDYLNAPTYKALTYPWLRSRLDKLSLQSFTNVAVGIEFQGKPVGLVLAECLTSQNRGNILSLFVNPEHRQRGLGTALLIQVEELLKEHGYRQMDILYSVNLTTPMLERMLKQQNWSYSSLHGLRCLTNLATIQQASFLNRYTLPKTFTIFPWMELTAQERAEIEQRDNGLNYPDELCPFIETDPIEALSSLGLRYRDEIVGWCVVHRIMPNCVNYRSLFVKPEFQAIGRAIPLLFASINRQITNQEVTNGLFFVLNENLPMMRFANHRLAPYLTAMNLFWKSSKLLQSPTANKGNCPPVFA
jgi:GNAT superfamily N-acetyltransferase